MRGAGFPVRMLEKLAAPDAVAAIEKYLESEIAFEDVRRRALATCGRLIKDSDGDVRKSLKRARRQMAKDRAPASLSDIPDMKPLLDAVERARETLTATRGKAERCLADAVADISNALRDVGRDLRFREAVAWQNRDALHQGIDALLRTPTGNRNAKARRKEQLLIRYLERYCAKNETIGFFGPLCWGAWTDNGASLTQRPGPDLLAERKVHFEYWAINALAEALSSSPHVRKWLRPRLDPRIRLEGNDLVVPAKVRSLPPDVMRVLAACSGEATAAEIAAGLVANTDCRIQTEDEVYRVLDQAARKRLVSWTLEVPVGPSPERTLRKTLESVGDPGLRSQLLGPLDQLESARDAVVRAAGDYEAVDAALGELESVFTKNTGRDPTQHLGQVYAGRGLVYEDCRRQTDVEIGPDMRKHVGPPLALVLQSARWFSYTIAARFEDYLKECYAELQARLAPQPVPVAAMEFLFDPRCIVVQNIVRKVVEELTERWASILPFEPASRRLFLSTDQLRDLVSLAFDAPGPGWPGARHHSADILIASEGPQAAQSGRCLCVLGEVHVTDTMLTNQFFLDLHPRPEDLAEAYQRDVEQPGIFRVTPRNSFGHRKVRDPYFPSDFQLAWDDSPPWRPNHEVLRVADLVIESSAGGLVVRTRDNARCFPAVVYFQRLLWGESFTSFKLIQPARHTPRIVVDNLVISRESWRFPCRDLAFIFEKTEIDRFIGTRRWARNHGLPHWVFARFPQEFKPLYVDLESPASAEAMAALARRAIEVSGDSAELSLSEMLPNPAQSWLTDARGDTYTSELRIVAVDPKSWHPPGGCN